MSTTDTTVPAPVPGEPCLMIDYVPGCEPVSPLPPDFVLPTSPTSTTVTVPSAPAAAVLPATGAEVSFAGIGVVLVVAGMLACRAARRPEVR